MKFYQIGYGGYEGSQHLTLVGEAEISRDDLQSEVRTVFREISMREIEAYTDEDREWLDVPFFGSRLREVASIIAEKYGLQLVENNLAVDVWGWEYEFSKQAADKLLERFPGVRLGFRSDDYVDMTNGKTPKPWTLMGAND